MHSEVLRYWNSAVTLSHKVCATTHFLNLFFNHGMKPVLLNLYFEHWNFWIHTRIFWPEQFMYWFWDTMLKFLHLYPNLCGLIFWSIGLKATTLNFQNLYWICGLKCKIAESELWTSELLILYMKLVAPNIEHLNFVPWYEKLEWYCKYYKIRKVWSDFYRSCPLFFQELITVMKTLLWHAYYNKTTIKIYWRFHYIALCFSQY